MRSSKNSDSSITPIIEKILQEAVLKKDFLISLEKHISSPESSAQFLTPAQKGLGYCIDERPIAGIVKDSHFSKISATPQTLRSQQFFRPCIPGGFLGVICLLILAGQNYEKAADSAAKIYKLLGWQMEAHTDDDHANLKDPVELARRRQGCGFAKVADDLIQDLGKLAQEIGVEILKKPSDKLNPEDALDKILANSGRIVVLTGAHHPQARLVINLKSSYTLDRFTAWQQREAIFVADVWILKDKDFVCAFNQATGKSWDPDLLQALGIILTLMTAQKLKVLQISSENKFSNLEIVV